jgi:hypothetical protein
VNNLRDLRVETSRARTAYTDLLSRADAFLDELAQDYPFDPWSPGIEWYRPATDEFWTTAARILPGLPPDRDTLAGGCPQPHPELRQSPPM